MERYNFKTIESKWQKYWQENKSFKKDYRLRKDTGDKLSISLKQYEGFTLNILAMVNVYVRENNLY